MYAFYFLFDWIFQSQMAPQVGFVKCVLPFILTCVAALIVVLIVFCIMRKIASIIVFIMGAAAGALAGIGIRQILLAVQPSLATDSNFMYYWFGLAGVAVLCGLIAMCCFGKKLAQTFIMLVACGMGGYGVAIALCGLFPVFGGPYVPDYGFFITFGGATFIGVLIQCGVKKLCPGKTVKGKKTKEAKVDDVVQTV